MNFVHPKIKLTGKINLDFPNIIFTYGNGTTENLNINDLEYKIRFNFAGYAGQRDYFKSLSSSDGLGNKIVVYKKGTVLICEYFIIEGRIQYDFYKEFIKKMK